MARFARLVALIAAVFMAVGLVWDAARDPFLGLDYTLYGTADRPSALVGHHWPSDRMKQWAEQYKVDVVVGGSPAKPGVMAGYPASSGSTFSRWVRNGYPCLREPCAAQPISLDEHPEALQSYEIGVAYMSFMGDNAQQAAFAAKDYFTHQQRWPVDVQDLDSPRVWITRFRTLFLRSAAVIAVMVLMLMGGHVLARSKAVGIQLLQGASRAQILCADALVWTASLTAWAAAVLVTGWLVSHVLVHGHMFGHMALTCGLLVAVFWIAGLCGLVAAHQALRFTSIRDAIKGKARFGITFPIMYVLRSLVVVLFGALLLVMGHTTATLRSDQTLRADMGPMAGFSSYAVNTGAADNPDVQKSTAVQLAPLYAANQLVVTRAKPAFFYDNSATIDTSLNKGDESLVMEVNPAYLALAPTRLSNGRLLDPRVDLPADRMTVIFPEGTADATRQGILSYVHHSMFAAGDLGTVPGWDRTNVPISELTAARTGNHHYAISEGAITGIADPVMICLPQRFVPGTDLTYTGEGFLVRTDRIPQVLKAAPSLQSGITGFTTLEAELSQRINLSQEDLSRETFELAAYLILLPIGTVALVLLYTREHMRRIFVQSSSGRPLWEMAPLLVVFDTISTVACLWFARPKTASMDQLQTLGSLAVVAPTYRFAAVAGIIAVLLAMQYLLLRRTAGRVLVTHLDVD